MKKIFITLCVAMFTVSVYAQGGKHTDEKKKKLNDLLMEVFGGANFANLPGDGPKSDPLTGLVFGVRTGILNFSENVQLGIGAEYSMQGAKQKSSDYVVGGGSESSTRKTQLNYLNFPILARYQRSDKGFFAEGGIQPGILLSAKNKSTTTTDIKDQLKTLDVGISLGVGYEVSKNLGIGFRITPGLSNIHKENDYSKNRNMVASLRASYSL